MTMSPWRSSTFQSSIVLKSRIPDSWAIHHMMLLIFSCFLISLRANKNTFPSTPKGNITPPDSISGHGVFFCMLTHVDIRHWFVQGWIKLHNAGPGEAFWAHWTSSCQGPRMVEKLGCEDDTRLVAFCCCGMGVGFFKFHFAYIYIFVFHYYYVD